MCELENRMVIDELWGSSWLDYDEEEEVEVEAGYLSMGKDKTFVSDEDAFDYALDRFMNGTEEEKKEFREGLVEWFFSGMWVRVGGKE